MIATVTRVMNSALQHSHLRQATIVLLGTGLLTLSAKTNIPFLYVPFTMQTYCLFALGCLLGPRTGVLIVLAYLLEGALGLPVFAGSPAKGVGLAYLCGPTAGYLIGGFIASVAFIGYVYGKGAARSRLKLFMLFIAAALVNDSFGLAWLWYMFDYDVVQKVQVSLALPLLFKSLLGALTIPYAHDKIGAMPR